MARSKSKSSRLFLRIQKPLFAAALFIVLTSGMTWAFTTPRVLGDEFNALYPSPAVENFPPAILRVSGPTTLAPGEVGTWFIRAYDPEDAPLSYSVVWNQKKTDTLGQGGNVNSGSSNRVKLGLKERGTYIIQFAVTDSGGVSAYDTRTVVVE